MVSIDDAFVKDESEMWIDTGSNADGTFKKLWETTDGNPDEFGNNHVGALQFSYVMSNGEVLPATRTETKSVQPVIANIYIGVLRVY